MDILSESFDALRLTGSIYFKAEIMGDWAIKVPSQKDAVRLHLVLQGRCYWRLSSAHDPIQLHEGDMVLVTRGEAHFLASRPGLRPVPLDRILKKHPPDSEGTICLEGKGDHRVRLLCGACDFDDSLSHPALSTLPEVVLLRAAELGLEPWLGGILKTMAMEAERGGYGMNTVLNRLLEVVFVQAMRTQALSQGDTAYDYLKALRDPKLFLVLQAIHSSPGEAWTVTSLAALAGMSRSVLSEKFTKMLGEPPMTYLRRWRLLRARDLLRYSMKNMSDIAETCGYASVPSFSRRFTDAYGVTPGKYRKSGTI